jgi:pimeloyl-ACP methyl ester carboxylesterase
LLLMESGLHAPGPPGGLRGRTGECALLDDLVSAIRRGESRSVLLRGEAGIGKTALLEYLVASASDLRVVRAVGVESEMELAFASLHQLCAPLLGRIEELPAPQRRALETVFGLSDGVAPDRFLVGLAVLSLFAAEAEQRPLLCVVDDAQWLDRASALTLAFVARRLLAERVGLVFAAREPGLELQHVHGLDVLGLRNGDSRALLRATLIPSIPGYGFSGKPTTSGWGPERVAGASVELMKRLGYRRFVAQGGDWGAVIVDLMAVQAPPELLGIHSNMPGVRPPEIAQRFRPLSVAPAPAGLSAEEQRCYEQVAYMYTKGIGYAAEMLLHPQTLYGIADSPAGLAAWILDHDAQSYLAIASAFVDGAPVGNLTRDEVLDNITLTWLTNTGISSARLYDEDAFGFFDAKGVSVPAAVTVFQKELYQAPRSWTERAYPNLIYYNEVDRGGHFAAWQEPQLFSEELRAAFRSLR